MPSEEDGPAPPARPAAGGTGAFAGAFGFKEMSVDQRTATEQASTGDDSILPDRDWTTLGKRLWQKSGEDKISLVASGIAFNAFLAFVPLLTSVVLTYGIVASPEQVAGHISALSNLLPGQAAEVVGTQLRTVVETASSATGLGLFVTLGIALYGALRGADGIISGLNIIYEIDESRSLFQRILVGIAITLGLIVSFLLASAGISLIAFLSAILPDIGGIVDDLLQVGYWIAAATAVSVVTALIYRYAPNRDDTDPRWLTAGSVTATIVWLIGTWLFGLYVRSFGNFGALYGALGAVIVFVFWLYISAYILLLGAELNQVLAGKRPSGRRQ